MRLPAGTLDSERPRVTLNNELPRQRTTMPLDPYLASRLHLMEGLDFHNMSDEMTARMVAFYEDPSPWTEPDTVEIVDDRVNGAHGEIPVRVYASDSPSNGPVLVWAHGGGFATGDLDMLEAHLVSAELSARSGSTVVSVDYRLARNGVTYPIPVDDVHAVLEAVLDGSIETVGPARTAAVGGASAGAALAIAAARRVVDASPNRLSALLLAYPLAHFPHPGVAPEISSQLAVLPSALRTPSSNVEWMVRNYVGRITDVPVDAIPGAGTFGGLPRTAIVVSEYDDLRSSAELLVRQLEDSGVAVSSYLASGMVHGHLNRSTALSEVDRSLAFLAEALHD